MSKNAKKVEAQVEVETEANVVAEVQFDIAALMEEHKTKSAVIRHLNSQGLTTGKIAKLMNIRYQHVRNVLTTPLKKKA